MNLPEKKNFMGLRGMDARTGKSNFDIAEWMLIQLIEALPEIGGFGYVVQNYDCPEGSEAFMEE